MDNENVLGVTLALELPSPWQEACATAITSLLAGSGSRPEDGVWPHISLCQSFVTPAPIEQIVAIVRRVATRMPPGWVTVGDVAAFAEGNGPLVVYIAACSSWLRLLHARLMRETAAVRAPDNVAGVRIGNPAFDLAGYTPHITLADTERRADLASLAVTASTLWRRLRPQGDGFAPEFISVRIWPPSRWHEPWTDDDMPVLPIYVAVAGA